MEKRLKRLPWYQKLLLITVVILLICLCVALVFLWGSPNGVYISESYKDVGVTTTLTINESAFTIKASNGDAENSLSGTVEINDDQMILITEDNKRIIGYYDKKFKTITVEGVIFRKE